METICNILFWFFYVGAILVSSLSLSQEVVEEKRKIFKTNPRFFLVIFYMLIPYYYIGSEFEVKFFVGLIAIIILTQLHRINKTLKGEQGKKNIK